MPAAGSHDALPAPPRTAGSDRPGGRRPRASAGRPRPALRLLVERAPRVAHRYVDGGLREVEVDELMPGDVVSVRAGEMVPADGVVEADEAALDESALTGEALPIVIARYGHVRS